MSSHMGAFPAMGVRGHGSPPTSYASKMASSPNIGTFFRTRRPGRNPLVVCRCLVTVSRPERLFRGESTATDAWRVTRAVRRGKRDGPPSLAPDFARRLVRPTMESAPEVCSVAEAERQRDILIGQI